MNGGEASMGFGTEEEIRDNKKNKIPRRKGGWGREDGKSGEEEALKGGASERTT